MDQVDQLRWEMKVEKGQAGGDKNPWKKPGSQKRQPQATVDASVLGQDWYSRGNSAGFDFPYDVNFFSLALQRNVDQDVSMKTLAAAGKQDRVRRWVLKMSERWWTEYVTNEIHAGNAKGYFLDVDWDDVKEYARSCLRAAYLKDHGETFTPPQYPGQQEYQQRLERIRMQQRTDAYYDSLDASADPTRLDEEDRSRLRSWRKKRGPEG